MFTKLLPLLLLLLTNSLVNAIPGTTLPNAKPPTCYSGVYIITARGTGESQGLGDQSTVIQAIMKKIPNSNVSAVVYPAMLNFNTSLPTGVTNAQQQIQNYYQACPSGRMVLMGYSQGAMVIGNAIAGGGTMTPWGPASGADTPISQKVGKSVMAVIMFGDPQRVKGQGIDSEASPCMMNSSFARTGVNYSNMQFYANRLNEYCSNGDPICCSTGINPIAHLSYFNTQNANAIAGWVAAKFAIS